MNLTHKTMRQKSDIDQMFIGALRTHTGPLHIELLGGEHGSYTIPMPDKQLGFELSLAIQNYYRRRNKR